MKEYFEIGDRVVNMNNETWNHGKEAKVVGFGVGGERVYVMYDDGTFGDSDYSGDYKKIVLNCNCNCKCCIK